MFQLVQQLHLQNGSLRQTRDLLLPRLMSGQLMLGNVDAASKALTDAGGASG